ncbi:MAG: o-succinylbenzoate synthase [Actinomycetaceae bacterium]|nr:o-succinylbenzoate synthase [Actinomycetaceae bacterium]
MTSPAASAALIREWHDSELPTAIRRILDGIDRVLVYQVPMRMRFRGVTAREGLLLHGENGWGEAAPFWEYGPAESSWWLRSALDGARRPRMTPPRDFVAINATIPVCSPEKAVAIVAASGASTAKIKVADPNSSLHEDCERIEAVAGFFAAREDADSGARAAVPGKIRVDANAAWDEDAALQAIRELNHAAHAIGGLEYVEQPCPSIEQLAAVRQKSGVRIAADESIRRAEDPLKVARSQAADVAIIKVAPLGGVMRAVSIARETGLDVVLSSALESSVGLQAGALAASLATDAETACGLGTASLLAADVTTQPLIAENGRLALRDISPDEDRIVAASTDPATRDLEQRWLRRLEEICTYLSDVQEKVGA